jgi:hypothetical protein
VEAPRKPPGFEAARQVLERWVRQLAGARISVEIPISESRLNQWLGDWVRRSSGTFEKVQVHLRSGGEIDVRLTFRHLRLAPAVTIHARIVEQPRLPESPVFALRWSLPGTGRLAAFVGPAIPFFVAPPPGIMVNGDRVMVDVAQLLRQHGCGDLFTNVTALYLDTGDATMMVNFQLQLAQLVTV